MLTILLGFMAFVLLRHNILGCVFPTQQPNSDLSNIIVRPPAWGICIEITGVEIVKSAHLFERQS